MTTLREAAQQALEALELGYDSAKAEADQYHAAMAGYRQQRHDQMDADVQQIASAITALRAVLAEPVLQTCNCRWDGEMQMQQCTLHEAHVDAIKEWAQRAKFAEKKLAALAEPEGRCEDCGMKYCECGERK